MSGIVQKIIGVTASKPIKLYSHPTGPNPWKVTIILNELNLPYETQQMDFGELKKEPFESINPNGRVPAIEDPNTGYSIWESGAIIEYLLETYDPSNSLSYTSKPEKFLEKSWLHFQMSGQGPYFGQKAWFTHFHQEKDIKSAIDRYGNEIRRVTSVIDRHLKKTGQQYLVGDKVSYADLSFVPWQWMLSFIMGEDFLKEYENEYPAAWAWNQRLNGRPAVSKSKEEKDAAMAAAKG